VTFRVARRFAVCGEHAIFARAGSAPSRLDRTPCRRLQSDIKQVWTFSASDIVDTVQVCSVFASNVEGGG
jgi:hypothetical protein